MAQLLAPQIPGPREKGARSQAAPVVVCPLEPSRDGQHAAAVAASLSRGLGWRLTLVPVGSTPAAAWWLASAAADAEAALVVVSVEPELAEALVERAGCPVVVAPRGPQFPSVTHGPLVCALDNAPQSAHVAAVATRFALALGSTLRVVHTGPQVALADVPDIGRELGATLLIAGTQNEPGLVRKLLGAADIPVMLIPGAS
jgi:hypothetical protein